MLGLSSFFLFISFLHVFLNLTKTSANSSANKSQNIMQEIAVNAILTKDEWDTMPGGLFDQVLDCFEFFIRFLNLLEFFDQVHKSLALPLNLSLNYSFKSKYKYYSYKSKCKYTANQEPN